MNALSTLRFYEIAGDYLQALEALGEIDNVPPEDIANTLETLQGTFEQKAINVAAYVRSLEARKPPPLRRPARVWNGDNAR